MRQMLWGGLLILLVGIGYLGWIVLHDSTAPQTTLAASGVQPLPNPAQISPDVVLRLNGSNTIGVQMAPMMATAFLKAQGATDITTKGGGMMDELSVVGMLNGKRQVIEIKQHGSASAFADLGSGECDIGLASRKIQAAEVAELAALGDMTGPAAEHVVGLDGLAVIVSKHNPVSKLSKQDIAKIFAGEIKQWKDVGGSGGKIKVYARDARSGTAETFRSLVLRGKTIPPAAMRFEDGRALSAKVSADPAGIGFIAFQYILDAKPLAVFETGAKALYPTPLTVSTEDYLLSRRLYFYTAPTTRNPFVSRFLDFAVTPEGQEVVSQSGFVSLDLMAHPSDVPADAPADYKRFTQGAQRLCIDFRFRPASTALGNKALPDLERVKSFMSGYGSADIMLFGFAENSGARDADCHHSRDLANAVAAQLSQRGLQPSVVQGFCSDLTVASGETEDGREKNRRVEIWVKQR